MQEKKLSKKINKKDFIQALAPHFANNKSLMLSEARVAQLSDKIINYMIDALKQGRRIEIRGFGCFVVKDYGGRILRSPRNGDILEIKPRRLPRFKLGKALKARANKAT